MKSGKSGEDAVSPMNDEDATILAAIRGRRGGVDQEVEVLPARDTALAKGFGMTGECPIGIRATAEPRMAAALWCMIMIAIVPACVGAAGVVTGTRNAAIRAMSDTVHV